MYLPNTIINMIHFCVLNVPNVLLLLFSDYELFGEPCHFLNVLFLVAEFSDELGDCTLLLF